MNPEDEAVSKKEGLETRLLLLDRIEYHSTKLREEGRKSLSSPEWIASQRRSLERQLAQLAG